MVPAQAIELYRLSLRDARSTDRLSERRNVYAKKSDVALRLPAATHGHGLANWGIRR